MIDSDSDILSQSTAIFRFTNVIPVIKQYVSNVYHLSGPLSAYQYINSLISTQTIDYISASGHGEPDRLIGQNSISIFESGLYSPSDVANKIIHFLACSTAIGLGVDMVKNGAKAFIGYSDLFVFDLRNYNEFFECDAEIDYVLTKGGTVEDAHFAALAKFNHYIDYYDKNGDINMAELFALDRRRLRSPVIDKSLGDCNAKI